MLEVLLALDGVLSLYTFGNEWEWEDEEDWFSGSGSGDDDHSGTDPILQVLKTKLFSNMKLYQMLTFL